MSAIESEKPTHIITSNNLKNFYVVNAFNKEKYFLSSFLVMNDNNLIKLNQLSTNFNNTSGKDPCNILHFNSEF